MTRRSADIFKGIKTTGIVIFLALFCLGLPGIAMAWPTDSIFGNLFHSKLYDVAIYASNFYFLTRYKLIGYVVFV